MSGPGMKKLLGSVRRALSNRTGLGPIPSSSPTQGSFPHIPPLGVRGATINRLPGTAVVPQARSRNTGLRVPMRIDLLGAEIAEDFKKAVQEEQEAEAALKKAPSEAASHHGRVGRSDPKNSEARMSRDISHAPLPLRVLRRRPGGDLRAVTNVGDLTTQPLRRPMSTGSMTMYSDSVRSSYLLADVDSTAYVNVTSDDFEPSAPTGQTYSLGALAEAQPKQRISLFSTHSSHPIMRPSFEKEAQMLAQIPDDIDDDGGVESALLKLEGKYEQRKSDTSNSQFSGIGDRGDSFGARPLDVSTLALDDEEDEEEEQRRHRHEHTVEAGVQHLPSYYPQQSYGIEELKPSVYRPRGMDSYPAAMSPRSVESYNSTPLLERGLSEHGMVKRSTRNWSEQSIFRGPSTEKMAGNEHTPDSSHVNSFDFIDDSDSLRRIPVGHTMPQHQIPSPTVPPRKAAKARAE
ncbi:hypothetical protein M7I_0510 [Glarea lozoyensis 74030]|uniref:Uncharacterized protein n=1 Tax=Glarea lozoyensis (strain ATCC 74030 / MF5533) TaxID=1104152 RepID=H0EDQ5_GLAL7|nr:hypothetical protein M7I_0510 [Glarea lozoyensis 74030]